MSDRVSAPLQWRPMAAADLPAVGDLAARIHPDFPERLEVLTEKFRLFPRGCFVLESAGPALCGYCLSHPWTIGSPPALDVLLGALPEQPNAYFIHDLTVEAVLRRRRLASALVLRLIEIAGGLGISRMMLVAVSGSEPFWSRMGFRRMQDERVQAQTRTKYGAGAVQMERDIPSSSPPPERGRSLD